MLFSANHACSDPCGRYPNGWPLAPAGREKADGPLPLQQAFEAPAPLHERMAAYARSVPKADGPQSTRLAFEALYPKELAWPMI